LKTNIWFVLEVWQSN